MSNIAHPIETVDLKAKQFTTAEPNLCVVKNQIISSRIFAFVLSTLAVLSLFLLVVAEFLSWRLWEFDDAMIVYRMVNNLLHDGLWAYNIGEHYNPSTSILNPILIASIAKAGVSIPFAAHILSAACVLFSGILAALLFEKQPIALRALIAYSVALLLSRNSTIGLETNLFSCGVLLLLVFEQKNLPTWLLIGFLALIRPDALLLVPCKLALDYGRKPILLKNLALIAIPILPWIIFSMIEFGRPFPDTLLNKIWQGSSGYWGQGWIFLKGGWEHIKAASWITQASYILAPVGVWYAWRTRASLQLLIGFCIIRETAYTLLNVPGYHWYYANADLCALLSAWIFVANCVKTVGINSILTPVNQKIVGLVCLISLLGHGGYSLWQAQVNTRLDPRNEAYKKAVGAILADYPQVRTLAALEVGTLGFYAANVKMIDLIGLASSNREYITGQYNDMFFENPPEVVLLHNPIWHFERAISEDLRFELLYENSQPLIDPNVPMQYYKLRSDFNGSLQESLSGGTKVLDNFVRDRYAGVRALADIGGINADESSLCIIDQVNGVLNSIKPVRVSQILSVRGWAVNTKNNATSGDIPQAEVIMLDATTMKPRYALPLIRHDRPDVAEHLNNKAFVKAGIEGKAHVMDVAPGLYALAIRQRVASNETSAPSDCITRSQVEVSR